MNREVERKYKIFKNSEEIKEIIKISNNKWETKHKNNLQFLWHSPFIDHDLEAFLSMYDKDKPQNTKLLDLGTCNGSQAIHVAKKGFNVVGSEVSPTALKKIKYDTTLPVKFVLDDILDTRFKEDEFDIIFDRGCFHSIVLWGLDKYIKNILKILKKDGTLLLKVLSDRQKRFMSEDTIMGKKISMPYRFSQDMIVEIFREDFDITLACLSYFHSSLCDSEEHKAEYPMCYFFILQPK